MNSKDMEKKQKRVLSVELDDDVKKVSITGMSSDEKVVMHKELSEDELDNVTGGYDMREERLREIEAPHYVVGDGYGLGEFDGPPRQRKDMFSS